MVQIWTNTDRALWRKRRDSMDYNICINQIFHDMENGEDYRILWISPQNEYAYWIPIQGKSGMPVLINLPAIYERLREEHLIYEEEPFQIQLELSVAEKENNGQEKKKLGRPPHKESAFGKNLVEQDFKNFDKALRKYYLTRRELSF